MNNFNLLHARFLQQQKHQYHRKSVSDALHAVSTWKGARRDNFPSDQFDHFLDDRHRFIKDMCVNKHHIVKYGGSLFVFVAPTMSWHHARGRIASMYVCDLLGIKNVTVNFQQAVSSYFDFAATIALEIGNMVRSVCISTWRVKVTMNQDVLCFEKMQGLIPSEDNAQTQRISGFCFAPLSTRVIPGLTTHNAPSLVQTVLSSVFETETLLSLMWIIGNGLIDPVHEPRIAFLYGEGRDGKTTTISVLQSVLEGACCSLTHDYVCSMKEMTAEDVSRAASSRFIVAGNVNLRHGQLNDKFWKVITGGDMFASAVGDVTLSCTAIMASNDIWKEDWRLRSKWFVRRTLAMKMKPIPLNATPPPTRFSDEERSRFIADCIYIRMSLDSMVVSPRDALLTIFGSTTARSTRGVILDNPETFEDSCAATTAVAYAGLMEYEKLISLLSVMSKSLIVSDRLGRQAMRGIKLREDYDNPNIHRYRIVCRNVNYNDEEYSNEDGNIDDMSDGGETYIENL